MLNSIPTLLALRVVRTCYSVHLLCVLPLALAVNRSLLFTPLLTSRFRNILSLSAIASIRTCYSQVIGKAFEPPLSWAETGAANTSQGFYCILPLMALQFPLALLLLYQAVLHSSGLTLHLFSSPHITLAGRRTVGCTCCSLPSKRFSLALGRRIQKPLLSPRIGSHQLPYCIIDTFSASRPVW